MQPAVSSEQFAVVGGTDEDGLGRTPLGDRPPDVIARRLFERGGVDRVHVNGNVITVELSRGHDAAGISEIIGEKAGSILYVSDGALLRYITGD